MTSHSDGPMYLVKALFASGQDDAALEALDLANRMAYWDHYATSHREMAYTVPGKTMPEFSPGSRCEMPIGLRCPACDGATSKGQTRRLHIQHGLGTYSKQGRE